MKCPLCSCEAIDLRSDVGANVTALEREGTCYVAPTGVSGYCAGMDARRGAHGGIFEGHYGSASQVRRLLIQGRTFSGVEPDPSLDADERQFLARAVKTTRTANGE